MDENKGVGKGALIIVGLILALMCGMLFAVGGADQEQKDAQANTCDAPGNSTVSVSKDAPEMVKKYAKDLESAANASGLPAAKLAAQIETESQWNPNATSPVGAKGLTQFMPETWKTYGEGDATDPHNAIKAQGKYMGVLYKTFRDNNYGRDATDLAFAAYNAGEGAVQAHHGIPPYTETQNYVRKIRDLSGKYEAFIKQADISETDKDSGSDDETMTERHKREAREASASASADNADADSCGGTGTGANHNTTGKDDYPWKNMPHCNADYSSCPAEGTPLGFYPSECVDFAAWRANQQLGGDEKNIKFDNSNPHMGNAVTWLDGWKQKGWKYGTEPKKGAMVYYAPGKSGASSMGHLAVVKDVTDNGATYTEEGYNGEPAPNDHKYYVHPKQPKDKPTYFLYLPEK